MGFYIVLLFLCSYLLYVLIEEMYQNLLDEFGMDKSQSLSIGKNNYTSLSTYLMRNIFEIFHDIKYIIT